MQIVIDIPEEKYNQIINRYKGSNVRPKDYEIAIISGTPLSKGHGRLIDADRLKTHFVGTEQGTDLEVYLEPTIINAPTVIEAESEG